MNNTSAMETKGWLRFLKKLLSFPLGASSSVESVWNRLVSFPRHHRQRREGNEAPDIIAGSASHYREVADKLDDDLQELGALLERTIGDLEELDLDIEEGRPARLSAAEIAVPLRLALDEIDGISHRLPSYEKTKR